MSYIQRVSQSSHGNAHKYPTQTSIQSSRTAQEATKTCMKDFHIEKKIGDGAYSIVFQVLRKSDNKQYAIKQVKIQKLSDKEKNNALNEVRILASIEDRNIIAYKEAFFDEPSSSLCVVMEYADGGDLYHKILTHKRNQTCFAEREIWDCLIQMTRGLQALHDRQILHRDLKSANVFMEIDGLIKLGDLNVSKITQKDGLLFTQTGTPYYASPEVWKDQPYDSKSDIWSLGCVLYEMTTLNPPFTARDMDRLFQAVLSGTTQPIPQHYSKNLDRTLKQLLQVNPNKRPSCDQILNLTVVQDYVNRNKDLDYIFQSVQPSQRGPTTEDYQSVQAPSGDDLLKTIHMPVNLSQLQTVLPRAKYDQSDTIESSYQNRQFDRQSIISMAQQIVLPPIREFDSLQRQTKALSIAAEQTGGHHLMTASQISHRGNYSSAEVEKPQILPLAKKRLDPDQQTRKVIKNLKSKKSRQTTSVDVHNSHNQQQSQSTRTSIVRLANQQAVPAHDLYNTRRDDPDEVVIKTQTKEINETVAVHEPSQRKRKNLHRQSGSLGPPIPPQIPPQQQTNYSQADSSLPGLQASLQAIRSAKDLIDKQCRSNQNQTMPQVPPTQQLLQQVLPRTNSTMAPSANLQVIREKFQPTNSVGSLIHPSQNRQPPSTTRNIAHSQSNQSQKQAPQVKTSQDQMQIKEAKQNILKYLPNFESEKLGGDYPTHHYPNTGSTVERTKSKIIVDLSQSNTGQTVPQPQQHSIKLLQKPPIPAQAPSIEKTQTYSPKKQAGGRNAAHNGLGVSQQLQVTRMKQAGQSPGGGGLRHSESQKIVAGLIENQMASDHVTGSSSRYLPSIRPSHEELRQNSSSMLQPNCQNQNNEQHIEQLRYFAALRQKKQSRHNTNSLQSRIQHPQSSGHKKARQMVSQQNQQQYQSLERPPQASLPDH